MLHTNAAGARGAWCIWLGVLVLAHGLAPAAWGGPAGLTVDGPAGTRVVVEGSDRFRGEFVDWFDVDDGTPGSNAAYGFVHNRFRLGVGVEHELVEAYAEYQNTVLGNVPSNAPGPGGVYYANTARSTQVGNWLRQGWLRVRRSLGDYHLTLQAGRQPYKDGAETSSSDATLAWLRRARISQRLIGPFDYTANGRSFDGALVKLDHATFDLTGFALRPTSGGFEVDAGRHVSDIDLAGLSYTLKDRPGFDGTNFRAFWIYYADDRLDDVDVTATDNRALKVREVDDDEILVHTFGADLLHVRDLGPGRLDMLAWAAGQYGDWQSLDHRAWAYALELGYGFPEHRLRPWVRSGLYRGSGDDDPANGRHETFHQLLPTARLYAQTPFYNMMNNDDVFVQLLCKPLERLHVRLDGHWLQAGERNDLVYFGGGATKDDFFGFGGLPTGRRSDLAYLVDLALTFDVTDFLRLYGYYGHAFGQRALNAALASDQLNYGYVEAIVRF